MNNADKIAFAALADARPSLCSWLRSTFLRRRQMRSLAAAIRYGALA